MPYIMEDVPVNTEQSGSRVHCDDDDNDDGASDDTPHDYQGDTEERVYEAGNDDDHNDDDDLYDDDDPSDDNPHDYQGDTEERVYEGGKLHGTATFTSHTGDREERLPPQLYQPGIFLSSSTYEGRGVNSKVIDAND